uniref:flagellin N-terminal helical domain-containing protein n=1 Tax=Comamonas kerstersii TaxID=225992 RepID=UPI0026DBCABF
MQRLSSGLRVNSAKDDAAGLAIAERMNTQVKGLTVAARNANDGISLAQTAEGALGKVGDMLQRMRELAVQASNATNSDSDRVALQAEVKQLAAEIDRVAKQTNFNGQKILDGSFAGAVFQVGANSGDNVTLGALADTRASMVSNISYAINTLSFNTSDSPAPAIADFDKAIDAGKLKITVDGLPSIDLEGIDPANSSLERLGQVVTAINNKTADTGVTAYMTLQEGTQNYSITLVSSKLDENNVPLNIAFEGFEATTTGLTAAAQNLPTLVANDPWTDSAETAKFNADLAKFEANPHFKKVFANTAAAPGTEYAAYKASGSAADAEALQAALATSTTNFNLAVTAHSTWDGTAANAGPYLNALATAAGATAATTPGTDSDEAVLAEIATLAGDLGISGLNIATQHQKLDQRGVDDIDVTTQEGAWIALKKIDSAIDQINGARATLGAMQTRFENAVNNIDIQVENLSAARGRIVDADFAVETANLSRTQILQQAGTAMVAQANQIPQNVLQLLQG